MLYLVGCIILVDKLHVYIDVRYITLFSYLGMRLCCFVDTLSCPWRGGYLGDESACQLNESIPGINIYYVLFYTYLLIILTMFNWLC